MTRNREENAADMAHEEGRPKTSAVTIMAMISELIDSHMQKCDGAFQLPEDCPPHVVSEVHGTKANIDSMATFSMEGCAVIEMALDDGTFFNIRIEEA